MKLHTRFVAILLGSVLLLVSGCGNAAPSEANIQATIAAGVRATTLAQQNQNPTSAPTTVAMLPTDAPATTATQAATTAPFVPATTVAATVASATTSPATTAAPAATSVAPADEPIVFQPGQGQQPPTINLQLIFDASGSMAQSIGSETKIQAARRAMEQVIAQLPDTSPNLNVGFRVYGHKGDNTEARKAESCQSTELLVPVQGVNKDLLRQQTNAFEPTGWTPLTLALQKAGEDLQAGENTRNVIIMVTDGQETCGGDPCALAKALNESGAQVRIDVVGFGTAPDEATGLRCIAENSGGTYNDAANGDALSTTLQELIGATLKRSYLVIQAVNANGEPTSALKLQQINDASGTAVDLRNALNSADPLPLGDGEARLALPPGTYTFSVEGESEFLGGQDINRVQTYTAVVAEGLETVARIGVGGLTLVNNGSPEGYVCTLALQIASNSAWNNIRGPASIGCLNALEYNTMYPITPGRYRIVDPARNNAEIVAPFAMEAGKQITVRIRGN